MKKIMIIVLFLGHRVIAMEQNQENKSIKPESIKINKKLEKAIRKKDEACYLRSYFVNEAKGISWPRRPGSALWRVIYKYRGLCVKYTRRVELLQRAVNTKSI